MKKVLRTNPAFKDVDKSKIDLLMQNLLNEYDDEPRQYTFGVLKQKKKKKSKERVIENRASRKGLVDVQPV